MKNNYFTRYGTKEISILISVLLFILFSIKLQSQCVNCNGTSTNGSHSSAIGINNQANGNYSFVGGENSKANGRTSFSFGQSTNVYDNYAMGIGRYLEVYGSSSIAIGRFLKTLNPESMVIGYGFSETQTLDNNVNRSLMIGFESTKPTLFIGPSNGVNNTGKVGIGNVTDPQAKLHIKADANEEASLRLEPTSSTYNAVVYFTNSGHAVKAKTGGHLTFNTQSTKGFVFETGNMGIGVAAPSEKLDVAGNIKQSAGSSLTTSTIKAADGNGLRLQKITELFC